MKALRFKSDILNRKGNPYVHVEPARAAKLAAGLKKPIPVLVRITGEPEKSMHVLYEGNARYMAPSWKEGK